MLTMPKLENEGRRKLAHIITLQVRSLYVHSKLNHPALHTESFIFRSSYRSSDGATLPDFTRPYILDWGHRLSSSSSGLPTAADMLQHPGSRASAPLTIPWFNQAWALMMILSEIADWAAINMGPGPFRDEDALRQAMQRRRQLATNEAWKNNITADIFRYGFSFLGHTSQVLEQYSYWQVKGFYDCLCERLGDLAPGLVGELQER